MEDTVNLVLERNCLLESSKKSASGTRNPDGGYLPSGYPTINNIKFCNLTGSRGRMSDIRDVTDGIGKHNHIIREKIAFIEIIKQFIIDYYYLLLYNSIIKDDNN